MAATEALAPALPDRIDRQARAALELIAEQLGDR